MCTPHKSTQEKKRKNFKLKAHTISLKGNNSNKIRSKRKMLIINEPSSEKGKKKKKNFRKWVGVAFNAPPPPPPKKRILEFNDRAKRVENISHK